MAIESATVTQPRRKPLFSLSRRKLALRIFATVVMVVYTIVTIFPFYALFVRSFVATKDASELHLWIPKSREVPMEAEVGNLKAGLAAECCVIEPVGPTKEPLAAILAGESTAPRLIRA